MKQKQSKIDEKQLKKQLEQWTGLQYGKIIFDSEKDNWSIKTSVFIDKIINKKQLAFIIEDTDNEIFGYYLNTEIVEKYCPVETDKYSFEFNLHSNNNRLNQPKIFPIKNTYNGGYYLHDKNSHRLLYIGDIALFKNDCKELSYCYQLDNFDYDGIPQALCGKTGYWDSKVIGESFSLKKFIVVQMN